jgi:hypothetical protein
MVLAQNRCHASLSPGPSPQTCSFLPNICASQTMKRSAPSGLRAEPPRPAQLFRLGEQPDGRKLR